ncbi:MAG: TRAP transporter small permease [Dehalococcoidia bacterium]|nr:MAG: TRAP transporter small permease [Dehalococcoidia bacterium]
MAKVWRLIDSFAACLGYAGAVFGVVAISLMMVIITTNVVMRYFFDKPLLFIEELVAYLLVGAVFLGLAYTTREGAHVSVDLVVKRLSDRTRQVLDVVTSLLVLAIMTVYLWYGFKFFLDLLETQRRSITSLATPMWIPVAFMCMGFLLLCLAIVAHIVTRILEKEVKVGKGLAK